MVDLLPYRHKTWFLGYTHMTKARKKARGEHVTFANFDGVISGNINVRK